MKPRARRLVRNEQEIEDRHKRRNAIIALFIVGIMVFSSLAYVMVDNAGQQQMEYGDYEFEYRDLGGGAGVLVTEIEGQEVEFQNLPIQVDYLPVDANAVRLLKDSQQIALASDPTLELADAAMIDYARLQLSLAVPKAFNAMTKEDDRYTLPVLTCDQASAQMPVLLFANTNETASVTTQGACIIVNGRERDLMRAKDRLIFEYYDILRDGQVVE